MELRTDYSNVSFQNNGKLKLLIIVGTVPRLSVSQPSSTRLVSILMLSLPTRGRTMTTILMAYSSRTSSSRILRFI